MRGRAPPPPPWAIAQAFGCSPVHDMAPPRGLARAAGRPRQPSLCRAARHNSHGPFTASHFYDASVEEWARREPKLIRVEALLTRYGYQTPTPSPALLIHSAEWLRQELPVRIARTLRNFQNQPFAMAQNLHIQRLYEQYWHSFSALRQVLPCALCLPAAPEVRTADMRAAVRMNEGYGRAGATCACLCV